MDIIPKLHLAAERFRQYRHDKNVQNDKDTEKMPDTVTGKSGVSCEQECKDSGTPVSTFIKSICSIFSTPHD